MATPLRSSTRACLLALLLLACAPLLPAQSRTALRNLRPPRTFDHVHVQRLVGDSLSTGFVIWIKDAVPAHYHAAHSETVLVLRGKGDMRLGDQRLTVRKGDLIFIPKGTPHSVTVRGRMLQVLSSQSPWFDGTDRVMLGE